MQKNKWTAIVILTFLYSVLFFRQNAGINFSLFSTALVTAGWTMNPAFTKRTLFIGLCAVFSGIVILFCPSDLAIFANIISLGLFSAALFSGNASILVNFANSVYSIVGSFIFMVLDAINNFNTGSSKEKKGKGQKLLFYYIALLLFIIFISIYQNINPLFEKFTRELRLDFFSLKWIIFTLGGFLLVYGFIKHQNIPHLIEYEQSQEKPLESESPGLFEANKKQAFTFLFIGLNAVLLFITVLDINYLYLGSGLPEGITHKQFVHNGVGMLIFSILLGISIILYAFKGNLNFDRSNTLLKFMVYGWLIQNILMVISTATRNHMYIYEALLTYKRIGVYYWLALAATGLLVTLIKIHQLKRNWYLLRSTSFVAYLLLIVSCPIDWDQLISNYNISHIKDVAGLDKKYLISLSDGNLKQLYQLKCHPKFEIDSVYHYRYNSQSTNKMDLDKKLFNFLQDNQGKGWRSFNFRTHHIIKDIDYLNKTGILDSVDLTRVYADSLTCLLPVTNLKLLRLSNPFPNIEAFGKMHQFKNLHTLYLDGFYLRDTLKIKVLKTIKTLYVTTHSANDSITLSNLKLPYKLVVSRYHDIEM